MKITIKYHGEIINSLVLAKPAFIYEIISNLDYDFKYPIYYAKVNNQYLGLNYLINSDLEIELLDITNHATWLYYQNSLAFLFQTSVNELFGKTNIQVNSGLTNGLYITLELKLNDNIVAIIKEKMLELVNHKLSIKKHLLTYEDAFKFDSDIDNIKSDLYAVYQLNNTFKWISNDIIFNTSYLSLFDLKSYQEGLILLYPNQNNPLIIDYSANNGTLYDCFKEANNWGEITNIHTLKDLNSLTSASFKKLCLIQEIFHENKIGDIVKKIHDKQKKIILICGPSSSGKTTFANRLAYQLNTKGLKTLTLSTDDYFVNRINTPLNAKGEKDYETIKALDIELFQSNLLDLLALKKVDLPRYDFIKGEKIFNTKLTKIDENTVIIIEGIHALNDLLTNKINGVDKYKIYISPITSLKINEVNRISITDVRMLRRMVRDNKTRDINPKTTIKTWPDVRNAENVNIFPFVEKADIIFNSYLIYETAILSKYVKPLLLKIKQDEVEYAEAQRLLKLLSYFEDISDEKYILNNSILREFIGNSVILEDN